MARDTEHFYWLLIGIPRGEILEFYQQEAAGMHETLPMHMRHLSVDRYEGLHGRGKGLWFPRDVSPSFSSQLVVPSSFIPREEEKVRTNASKAIQYMDDWDDEDANTPTVRLQAIRTE